MCQRTISPTVVSVTETTLEAIERAIARAHTGHRTAKRIAIQWLLKGLRIAGTDKQRPRTSSAADRGDRCEQRASSAADRGDGCEQRASSATDQSQSVSAITSSQLVAPSFPMTKIRKTPARFLFSAPVHFSFSIQSANSIPSP